jgi:hypothetical protein
MSILSAYSLRVLESDDPRLSRYALLALHKPRGLKRVSEDRHPRTKSVHGIEAFTSIKPLHRHGIATYIMVSMISAMLGSLNI